jgi:hypothetical protein
MPSRDQTLDAIFTAENRQGTNQYNYRYKEDPNYYTASGYFQIVNSTWRRHAAEVGVDLNQYPTAISAPYNVQRMVAGHLLDTEGIGPWANYNPAIRPLLAQIDRGENPYLHSGPKDAAAGNPLSPPPTSQATSGGLQFTHPATNVLGGAPPGPAPQPQDTSNLVAMAMLQKLAPNHSFQPVPYNPFVTPEQKSDFQASPFSAPQLHAMPSGKPLPQQSQAPGASGSAEGGLRQILGDETGQPSLRGRPQGAGSSSQYG